MRLFARIADLQGTARPGGNAISSVALLQSSVHAFANRMLLYSLLNTKIHVRKFYTDI